MPALAPLLSPDDSSGISNDPTTKKAPRKLRRKNPPTSLSTNHQKLPSATSSTVSLPKSQARPTSSRSFKAASTGWFSRAGRKSMDAEHEEAWQGLAAGNGGVTDASSVYTVSSYNENHMSSPPPIPTKYQSRPKTVPISSEFLLSPSAPFSELPNSSDPTRRSISSSSPVLPPLPSFKSGDFGFVTAPSSIASFEMGGGEDEKPPLSPKHPGRKARSREGSPRRSDSFHSTNRPVSGISTAGTPLKQTSNSNPEPGETEGRKHSGGSQESGGNGEYRGAGNGGIQQFRRTYTGDDAAESPIDPALEHLTFHAVTAEEPIILLSNSNSMQSSPSISPQLSNAAPQGQSAAAPAQEPKKRRNSFLGGWKLAMKRASGSGDNEPNDSPQPTQPVGVGAGGGWIYRRRGSFSSPRPPTGNSKSYAEEYKEFRAQKAREAKEKEELEKTGTANPVATKPLPNPVDRSSAPPVAARNSQPPALQTRPPSTTASKRNSAPAASPAAPQPIHRPITAPSAPLSVPRPTTAKSTRSNISSAATDDKTPSPSIKTTHSTRRSFREKMKSVEARFSRRGGSDQVPKAPISGAIGGAAQAAAAVGINNFNSNSGKMEKSDELAAGTTTSSAAVGGIPSPANSSASSNSAKNKFGPSTQGPIQPIIAGNKQSKQSNKQLPAPPATKEMTTALQKQVLERELVGLDVAVKQMGLLEERIKNGAPISPPDSREGSEVSEVEEEETDAPIATDTPIANSKQREQRDQPRQPNSHISQSQQSDASGPATPDHWPPKPPITTKPILSRSGTSDETTMMELSRPRTDSITPAPLMIVKTNSMHAESYPSWVPITAGAEATVGGGFAAAPTVPTPPPRGNTTSHTPQKQQKSLSPLRNQVGNSPSPPTSPPPAAPNQQNKGKNRERDMTTARQSTGAGFPVSGGFPGTVPGGSVIGAMGGGSMGGAVAGGVVQGGVGGASGLVATAPSELSVTTIATTHATQASLPAAPSASSKSSTRPPTPPKPVAKLFVICCRCKYWHDLPSAMYRGMVENGGAIRCPYCLHGMETGCCSG
ncbi:hypothetical protein FPQ18DRAFT_389791 [Pyronema domesticum]|nr:hypothetical protein FPQ18DRAFT_389791 [Pyronema domesticum]